MPGYGMPQRGQPQGGGVPPARQPMQPQAMPGMPMGGPPPPPPGSIQLTPPQQGPPMGPGGGLTMPPQGMPGMPMGGQPGMAPPGMPPPMGGGMGMPPAPPDPIQTLMAALQRQAAGPATRTPFLDHAHRAGLLGGRGY